MVTEKDIEHLAKLARIELLPGETAGLTSQIDSILGYVGQIQDSAGNTERVIPVHRNVLRDDVPAHASGEYTEKLLQNAPKREGDYLKVKKIL